MKLTHLLRIHAYLAFAYAILLGLLPQFTVALLSSQPLNPLSTDITRIFGAAVLFVGLMAFGASKLKASAERQMIVTGLFIYTGLGAIISLMSQLAGNWNMLGWSNFLVYFFIALGYAFFLVQGRE
jgi:heme A synthase